MRFASLFAGVGGFDLAFERAGMTCVAQVEIDTRCREVLATHWPHVPQFGDIYEVSGLDDLGSVDVLCGGFPCQDYSVAGKRGGLAGDRGALWWQFHRLIAECRPRWVVGENVPGLLSSNGGRDFGAIVGSLVELGYGVVWRVLDAQYFGVAQRRRRVFIVGHIGGIPRPEVLAFAEGCSGDTPPRRQAGEGTSAVTSKWSKGVGGPSGDEFQNLIPQTVGALRTRDWKGPPVDVADPSLIVERSRNLGIQGGEVGVVGVVLNSGAEHPADKGEFVGGEGHGGPFRLTDDDYDIPGINVKVFTQNSRAEVRDLNGHAGALAAEQGSQQTNYLALPSSVRRLTPLECERLQGFPDNWTADQSDTQRYRQMGNAVAVPVAEWIGKRLVNA